MKHYLKKVVLLEFILCCCILVGCGKKTKTEEPAANDDITSDKIRDLNENQQIQDEGQQAVTVSLLGKYDILIENDRIERVGSRPQNVYRFTEEETEMILSAVKGGWETDAEGGFSFSVMDYQTRAEKIDEFLKFTGEDESTRNIKDSFYIYVRNDDIGYRSPVNIILSMSEESDKYRDCFGSDTIKESENLSYPAFYIEFFVPFCKDGQTVFYKPAALALIPDGQIFLLYEKECYSLKNNIQAEIMIGNFESLDEQDDLTKRYAKQHPILLMYPFYDREWTEIDLNGDGIQDLVEQEVQTVPDSDRIQKMITAVFACETEKARIIEWDDSDNTFYSYLGKTGKMILTSFDYGHFLDTEYYELYHYDSEWNKIVDLRMEIDRVDSSLANDGDLFNEWCKEHPDMANDGIYYSVLEEDDSENRKYISREEFTRFYETETGLKPYSEFW